MAAPVDNMREDSHRKSRKRSHDAPEDQANQSVSDEPDQNPPKVQKAQDGREFRKSLKEGGGDLQDILKNFLISCNDTAPESGVDVIMQYLEVSPRCEELLDILNDENRPNLVIICTLRILTTVLIRFAESQSKYGVISLHIVRRLVRVHFGIVMSFLNVPKDWRSTKTALRLLTVIMTLGKQCAQELLSVFNLDHPSLQKLAQSRRPKEKEDPRTHFVQFAMSIFMTGNSDIIEKAVASKEFCRNVFHHIALDRVPTIQLLLRTLQDRVIKKPVIPKKSKKLLFNNFTLSQLIELYDCSKPVEAADVDIPHMVHNVLQLVCCSHKYGICYTDASLGLNGGRVANLTLLRFVSNFKTTSILNDPLMEDLFISIFKVCPDVLTPYLKGRSTKFTPRPYPDWLNNIILFEKIYNCFPDISPALMEKKRNTTVSRLLGLVAVTTLPFVYTREEYVKNFKGLCIPVHFGLLKICKIFLKRTLKTIKFCEDQKKEANSILSPEEWTEFIDSLKKSAREIMPDAEFFIGMYEKYQTHLRSENRKEDDYKDWVKKQMATPVPIPKPELVICGVLDILRLQQTLFPNCLQGLSLDLNAIFSESLSVLFIKNLSDEENLSIAIVQGLMEFLAGVPPKKILWFKESKRSGSIFSQVLTLLLSSKLVQQEAEQLLCKILMETGHFENNKEEAMSWLVALDDLSKSDQVGVIDLLRKSLIKIVRNPHPFNDRIAEAMTKRQQLLENDLQSETASVAEAGIAAILDQEEYTIEVMSDVVTMETNSASDGKTTMDKPLYCSALLPAALEEFFNLLIKSKGETGNY
ncbi:nucleolar pre-ribosomal-associated protein 1-like [Apostichopus japonicus]|uniref:nucleolar pre-ribosomal-associated protein 1-like n=1 Tax=Stichopus japonicus TaxID=307972 RepID=UPI003AB507DA